MDPEFDITNTGFELEEIEIMLDNEVRCDEDEVERPRVGHVATTRMGDVWELGNHRLIFGDALKLDTYEVLLRGEKAQMIIADNPYNVRMNENAVGKGKHREFVMASGEMSEAEDTAFLTTAFENLIAHSADGSIHFLFQDWRHLKEMVSATSVYAEIKNLICWRKAKDSGRFSEANMSSSSSARTARESTSTTLAWWRRAVIGATSGTTLA
jgi:hypothetical protein